MSQFRENLRTDARTDGLTLFYRNFPAEAESPIKLPSGQLNVNLTLMFMIRCKYYKKPIICGNISLVKVIGQNPIDWIYRIESNLLISPSVLFRGSCKFCRQYHHLLQRCSHHSMIRSNFCIAAMELVTALPEVFRY